MRHTYTTRMVIIIAILAALAAALFAAARS